MRTLKFGLVLAAALVAAACLPVTTEVPVGTTAGLSADPALIGTWKVMPEKKKDGGFRDGGPGFVHFLAGKNGAMTALTVSAGRAGPKGSEGEWMVFAASTATLGGHHYLNARGLSKNGKAAKDDDTGNIPMLYRFDRHGRLTLYLIEEKAAKAAIAAGRIAGTVGHGELGDATITAPADKLDAFFASKAGAGLFTEKLMTLKRVK